MPRERLDRFFIEVRADFRGSGKPDADIPSNGREDAVVHAADMGDVEVVARHGDDRTALQIRIGIRARYEHEVAEEQMSDLAALMGVPTHLLADFRFSFAMITHGAHPLGTPRSCGVLLLRNEDFGEAHHLVVPHRD